MTVDVIVICIGVAFYKTATFTLGLLKQDKLKDGLINSEREKEKKRKGRDIYKYR